MKLEKNPPWFRLVLSGLIAYGILCLIARILLPSATGNFPLEKKWVQNVDSTILAVSASENGILVIRTQNKVVGLSALSGNILWEIKMGSGIDVTPARFANGSVYVANMDFIWALDEYTGQILWRKPVTSPKTVELRVLTITNCCVLVNRVSDSIVALDRANGDILWTLETGAGFSAAYYFERNVFIVDKGIKAKDEFTGKDLWQEGNAVLGDSDYQDGVVYFKQHHLVSAFNAIQRSDLWVTELNDPGLREVKKLGEYIVVIGFDVHVLDAASGQLLWTAKVDNGHTPVMINNILCVFGGTLQNVVAFEPKSGQNLGELWLDIPTFFVTMNSTMSVTQNDLLIIGQGKQVYAYGKP